MDIPYPIRTGASAALAPIGGRSSRITTLREGFADELDIIDAPECSPAGGVRFQSFMTIPGGYVTHAASREEF